MSDETEPAHVNPRGGYSIPGVRVAAWEADIEGVDKTGARISVHLDNVTGGDYYAAERNAITRYHDLVRPATQIVRVDVAAGVVIA